MNELELMDHDAIERNLQEKLPEQMQKHDAALPDRKATRSNTMRNCSRRHREKGEVSEQQRL